MTANARPTDAVSERRSQPLPIDADALGRNQLAPSAPDRHPKRRRQFVERDAGEQVAGGDGALHREEEGQGRRRCLAGRVDLADVAVGLERAAQDRADQRSPARLVRVGTQDVGNPGGRSVLGSAAILEDEVGEGGQLAPVAASGNRHDRARRVIHPPRGYAGRYAGTVGLSSRFPSSG